MKMVLCSGLQWLCPNKIWQPSRRAYMWAEEAQECAVLLALHTDCKLCGLPEMPWESGGLLSPKWLWASCIANNGARMFWLPVAEVTHTQAHMLTRTHTFTHWQANGYFPKEWLERSSKWDCVDTRRRPGQRSRYPAAYRITHNWQVTAKWV